MLLTFEIIWTIIEQVIELGNVVNFFKHHVHLKWYKFLFKHPVFNLLMKKEWLKTEKVFWGVLKSVNRNN